MQMRSDMVAVYVARPGGGGRSWEFLQMQRRPEDYLGGTWSTVYGSMEPGETAWQTALRELTEETGIVAHDFFRLPTVRSFYTSVNDTIWHVPSFCAVIDRQAAVRLNEEHTGSRWAPRDQVEQMFLFATDRAAIAEICNEILSPAAVAVEHLRIEVPPK